MDINIQSISVCNSTLLPSLEVVIDINQYNYVESLLSISGVLKSADNKIIAQLTELCPNSSYSDELRRFSQQLYKRRVEESTKKNIRKIIYTSLQPNVIDYIEKLREKEKKKSVKFTVDVFVSSILASKNYGNDIYTDDVLLFEIIHQSITKFFEINQSEWIHDFVEKLGIGKFILLEYPLPSNEIVSPLWLELQKRLFANLQEMESAINSGDWTKSMLCARKFFENIKIGDSKKGNLAFKEEFINLMKQDNHGDEGVNELFSAIWKLFEFFSKYVHDKDRDGNLMLEPKARKEDAYFAYSVGIGLLNLLSKKIEQST
jgi:hypothetical protein